MWARRREKNSGADILLVEPPLAALALALAEAERALEGTGAALLEEGADAAGAGAEVGAPVLVLPVLRALAAPVLLVLLRAVLLLAPEATRALAPAEKPSLALAAEPCV